MPDRWPHAARWAAAHVLLAALGATLLCNGRVFSTWSWHRFIPDPFDNPVNFMSQSAPGDRIAIWFAQAFFAWLVLFASIPALGIALVLLLPGHRAWQQCAMKWSCYVTVTLLPIVGSWYAWCALFPVTYQVPGPITVYGIGPAPDLLPTTVGTIFGVYWAAGTCSVVYRRRSRRVARLREAWRRVRRARLHDFVARAVALPCSLALRAAPYAALFVAAQWVLWHVAFPAGSLEALR